LHAARVALELAKRLAVRWAIDDLLGVAIQQLRIARTPSSPQVAGPMGAPVMEITVNRCRKEQRHEYRLAHNLLPEHRTAAAKRRA
jgi:hypothetical protein